MKLTLPCVDDSIWYGKNIQDGSTFIFNFTEINKVIKRIVIKSKHNYAGSVWEDNISEVFKRICQYEWKKI